MQSAVIIWLSVVLLLICYKLLIVNYIYYLNINGNHVHVHVRIAYNSTK